MARYLIPMVATVFMVAMAHNSWATEDMPDPTRPPSAMTRSGAMDSGLSDAPLLQTIILRKGSKPAAIIGGERVELGGQYGGARLIRINETEVVLVGPSGRETLRLTPAVEKKLVIEDAQRASGKVSESMRKRK